jgi:hypothetical protein
MDSGMRQLLLPCPACGERVGVRGVLTRVNHRPSRSGPLPLTRNLRGGAPIPRSPRKRGEGEEPDDR